MWLTYPFPFSAGTMGMLSLSLTCPQEVHLVLNRVPENIEQPLFFHPLQDKRRIITDRVQTKNPHSNYKSYSLHCTRLALTKDGVRGGAYFRECKVGGRSHPFPPCMHVQTAQKSMQSWQPTYMYMTLWIASYVHEKSEAQLVYTYMCGSYSTPLIPKKNYCREMGKHNF